jgi:hypothetical protein
MSPEVGTRGSNRARHHPKTGNRLANRQGLPGSDRPPQPVPQSMRVLPGEPGIRSGLAGVPGGAERSLGLLPTAPPGRAAGTSRCCADVTWPPEPSPPPMLGFEIQEDLHGPQAALR